MSFSQETSQIKFNGLRKKGPKSINFHYPFSLHSTLLDSCHLHLATPRSSHHLHFLLIVVVHRFLLFFVVFGWCCCCSCWSAMDPIEVDRNGLRDGALSPDTLPPPQGVFQEQWGEYPPLPPPGGEG